MIKIRRTSKIHLYLFSNLFVYLVSHILIII